MSSGRGRDRASRGRGSGRCTYEMERGAIRVRRGQIPGRKKRDAFTSWTSARRSSAVLGSFCYSRHGKVRGGTCPARKGRPPRRRGRQACPTRRAARRFWVVPLPLTPSDCQVHLAPIRRTEPAARAGPRCQIPAQRSTPTGEWVSLPKQRFSSFFAPRSRGFATWKVRGRPVAAKRRTRLQLRIVRT